MTKPLLPAVMEPTVQVKNEAAWREHCVECLRCRLGFHEYCNSIPCPCFEEAAK